MIEENAQQHPTARIDGPNEKVSTSLASEEI